METLETFFCECRKELNVPHQVDMVKNESGFIHLAEDQQHLVVNELLVLFQVAVHVLLQLSPDLKERSKQDGFISVSMIYPYKII